ncbi:MAG: hypothetical protein R6W96_02145 [Clostridia bacterium]
MTESQYLDRRWNWGAFWLTWIWGLGNGTHIALLALVPGLNLVMPFVLGYMGDEWARRNKTWFNENHFKVTQRKWALAGWVVAVLSVTILSISLYGNYQSSLRSKALSDEILQIALADGWVTEQVGEDYTVNILGKTTLGDRVHSHTIFIHSSQGTVSIRTSFNDSNQIQNIHLDLLRGDTREQTHLITVRE